MLKRTDRRLLPTGGVLRFSNVTLLLFLFAGTIALTSLTGCGDDAPREDSNGSQKADSNAMPKPGDTMTMNAVPGNGTGTNASTVGGATSGPAAEVTASGKSAVKVGTPLTPGVTVHEQTTPAIRVADQARAGEENRYDASIFDGLLRANVANGKVDYAAFKSSAEFAKFFQSLAGAVPDRMPANEKLAFWINAYNACVIKNVNDNPGIKQPLDVPGFFDKKLFSVSGRQLTLNQIENDIIRPTFKDPLIHFGLVCAARSCPPLISKAYTEVNVLSQLAENAQAYLGDSKQNRYDAATKTLYLSKIFDWYKADFGGSDAGLIDFAKKHGPDGMKTALASASGVKVKFNDYDWTLNKK